MKQLNLEAKTKPQQLIKEYLEQSASDVLADKINNGVPLQKDGKFLLNKKTLDGFMNYANGEARKIAEKGSNYACVPDDVVFGWAVHYFEEDSIEEKLYNEDGTEYFKPKATPKKKAEKKPDAKKPEPKVAVVDHKKSVTTKKLPTSANQISFFDL